MTDSQATIQIHNLRLRTLIGFNPEEKVKKQDVVINILIRYAMPNSVLQDRVEGALNYRNITKKVINYVEHGQFLLLERLAGDILAVCSDHSVVTNAQVTVDKPNALRFADSVSVSLEYQADSPVKNLRLEKES